MTQELEKEQHDSSDLLIRGLYMLLFVVLYSITELVVAAVVIIQFLIHLLLKETNKQLLDFGHSLGRYIYQILLFQTFNTEEKPFPFNDWPHSTKDNEQ